MLLFSVLLTNLAPVLLMPIFNKFTPWVKNMPTWPKA
jgi:hypothetical protein